MAWVITKQSRFYLHEGETLLNGLIRTEHRPAFECCQGYCGACKLSICLITGEAHHTLPPLCHLKDGEVLACCCVVNGVVAVD